VDVLSVFGINRNCFDRLDRVVRVDLAKAALIVSRPNHIMNQSTNETNALKATARLAGLLYLVVVVLGYFSLVYIPSQFQVQGDASATVTKIVASQTLFRFGIVAGLICYTAFLLLPFVLFKLLGPVSRNAGVLMVVFAVVSVPISFVNMLNKLEILSLLSGADQLRALTTDQLQALVMFSLTAYNNGLLISKIFWGLWLLPFGYLVFKSGFLPKILGILLMMGCAGYQVDFLRSALMPEFTGGGIVKFVRLPAAFGEVGTCLWLLIMGVNPKAASANTRFNSASVSA